ncbi:MAG: hypothetical protein ACPGNV_09760 [Mangrovicoccus sp.]
MTKSITEAAPDEPEETPDDAASPQPRATPAQRAAAARQARQRRENQENLPVPKKAEQLPSEKAEAPVPSNDVNAAKSVNREFVPPAKPKRRHFLLWLTFILFVLAPSGGAGWYLWERAQDRYASNTAFSVYQEENSSGVESLIGLQGLGTNSNAPDADILYQYIQSQEMVRFADAQLDLRAMYSPSYDIDPVFSLVPEASIEDLVDYWERVVRINFAPDTGLISLEVIAFEPGDAQRLAQLVLDKSAALIDELSRIAREDAISQAQEDLDLAAARLKETRLELATFRDVEQIVDPSADLAGQMGVINALQQSLADAMVRRDTLVGTTTKDTDPRILQADRQIAAIETRIEEERTKLGSARDGNGDDPLSRLVGQYEGLLVDREFAEQSYLAAMAAYDAAVAEARRKSKYLATHIRPSLAETAIYPKRVTLLGLTIGFLLMAWIVMALVVYSIRDRR